MKNILLFLIILNTTLLAQTNDFKFNKKYFVENNNRIKSFNGTEIYYTTQLKNVEVWITNKGLIYNYYSIKTNTPKMEDRLNKKEITKIDWERTCVNLTDATILKKNETIQQNILSINYLTSNSKTTCLTTKEIIYKNIYNGIDWKIYFNEKNELKQDFIVHPGADVNTIKIQYSGVLPLTIENNKIVLNTKFGKFNESDLLCFQGKKIIPSQFKKIKELTINQVKLTEVGLNITNYDKKRDLIIDPILNWSTFFGGSVDDDVHGISNDGTNTWVVGHTQSPTFPVVNSGGLSFFQGSYSGGGGDGFLLKFDNIYNLIHATYLGGTGGEEVMAVVTNSNEVCISGFTSSSDFPTLNPGGGAYFQSALSGSNDGFLMKFNHSADLLWSTYVGGTVTEYLNALNYNNGDLFVGGVSKSSNFPTLNSGTFFQSFVFDNDAVIMKFNSTNAISWSTFMGGSGNDLVYSITTNSTNLIVVGNTNSAAFNTLNGGAYTQTLIAGGFDGFISKFSLNGNLQWSTFFGGNFNDKISDVAINNNVIYLTGTSSSTNLPVFNGGGGAYYQATNLGINDGFIAKFSINGTLKHSTYIGNTGNDYSNTISTEGDNFIVGGYSNSSTLTTLNDGTFYQNTPGGAYDIYLTKFDTSCVMQWGTFMGDVSNDYIESIECKNYKIYACGYTQSTLFPVLNPGLGAYFQGTGIGGFDALIFTFKNCSNPTLTVAPTATICAGQNLTLTASSSSLNTFQWYGPAVYSSTNAVAVVPAVTATNAGVYSIIVTSPGGCATSGNVTVTVLSSPTNTLNNNGPLCSGETLSLTTNSANSYSWSGPASFTSSIQNPIINNVSNLNSGTYTLQTTNSLGCSNTQTANISVNGIPTISISGATTVCEGASINLLGNGGLSYTWTSPSGSTTVNNTLTINNAQVSNAGTYTISGNSVFGCVGSTNFSVTVSVCTNINNETLNSSLFNYYYKDHYLYFNNTSNNVDEILLLDMQGKILIKQKASELYWDLNEFANGIYIINIKYKNGKIENNKLIIY